MREFTYFLFENFDADKESQNPENPRSFLGKETDAIVSLVAQRPVNDASYQDCCNQFGTALVHKLIDGGILRLNGTALVFDSPIFLREDAVVLYNEIDVKAAALVGFLKNGFAEISMCCSEIKNGFSIEENLYHVLCGMIFDGHFFDYLSGRGALTTSRQHASGLDYLTVIYETCEELRALSNGSLCSYNRLANEQCAVQSFGDAQGSRFDFYRLFRHLERGNLPHKFKEAAALLVDSFDGKNALLSEVVSIVQTGHCLAPAMELLELFGYVRNGTICVPVYRPEHQKWILEIERIVEHCLGEAMAKTLIELASTLNITAVAHGVNGFEIANELYHILFGAINEELVSQSIVACPQRIPDEGRYAKCIEVYL